MTRGWGGRSVRIAWPGTTTTTLWKRYTRTVRFFFSTIFVNVDSDFVATTTTEPATVTGDVAYASRRAYYWGLTGYATATATPPDDWAAAIPVRRRRRRRLRRRRPRDRNATEVSTCWTTGARAGAADEWDRALGGSCAATHSDLLSIFGTTDPPNVGDRFAGNVLFRSSSCPRPVREQTGSRVRRPRAGARSHERVTFVKTKT